MRRSVLAMRLRIRALLNATKNQLKAKPRNKPRNKPRKASPEKSSLPKRREAERREAHHRSRIETRCGARPVSVSSDAGGSRPGMKLGPHGAGALAFRRPTAALAGVLPPARLQAALPGITGCKREDPLRHQCSEHLAVRSRAGRDVAQAARGRSVWPHPREPPPLRPKEYPRDKASFVERDFG